MNDLERASLEGYQAGVHECLTGTKMDCPYRGGVTANGQPLPGTELHQAWQSGWLAVVEVNTRAHVAACTPGAFWDAGVKVRISTLEQELIELQTQDCTDPARARLCSTLHAAINALTHYRQSGQSLLRAQERLETARTKFRDTQGGL